MVRQATYQRDVAALTIMVKNMIDDINVFLQLHIESCILKTDLIKRGLLLKMACRDSDAGRRSVVKTA